jgi:hypothetical protein
MGYNGGLTIRKKLFVIGGILASTWAIITLFLAATAVEMEILIALLVFVYGGSILGIYFLIVGGITAKTKKGRWIPLSLAIIWILFPFLNEAYEDFHRNQYQNKLEATDPTEELVHDAFSELDQTYLQLPEDFYTYQNQTLIIRLDILEEEFLKFAKSTYKDVVNDLGEKNREKIDEHMIEDVFGRYLFNAINLHFEIWKRTSAPKEVNVELRYHNETISHTTSTQSHHIQGQEELIEQIKQFYYSLKPKLVSDENN